MTAQQNSTLIHDDLEECPSFLAMPEELSRFSPILPPKVANNTNRMKNYKQNVLKFNECAPMASKSEVPSKIQHQVQHGCQKYATRSKLQNYAASSCSRCSARSRTISLSGSNSTAEQGHKEIPIWVGAEPRYVSGVTSRTTCNDIIKALIDDEIRNGNQNYCCTGVGAPRVDTTIKSSRDCSDYVITENWHGIERSYDGNMAILPVWKAWNRVHNELRLSLKHRQDVPELAPISLPTKQSGLRWLQTLRKYLRKLFKLNKSINKQKLPKSIVNTSSKCKHGLVAIKEEETKDELLFVILPDNKYENGTSTEQCQPSKQPDAIKTHTNRSTLLRQKLYSLSETRRSIRRRKSPKSKRRATHSNNIATDTKQNDYIRRRRNLPTVTAISPSNSCAIRQQLAQKTSEIDMLYQREQTLTKQLNTKCRLYKLHNELYTKSDEQRLELSIGQIQRNIETYVEQIVQTEHELLSLKNEIKQDISLVNNLKRTMTYKAYDAKDADSDMGKLRKEKAQPACLGGEEMQFVDNIYEFCDNNASMLV